MRICIHIDVDDEQIDAVQAAAGLAAYPLEP